MRIGFGYDVHRLMAGYEFWIGGVKIEHSKGAAGHSDADTLIHAICDALLGAAALGDIGQHFPDTDPAYKGIDSKILLSRVMELIRKEGFELANMDCTVALQAPRISHYIPAIRETLAEVLNTHANNISVKATTTEKLGFEGREEGISCYAVALIEKR